MTRTKTIFIAGVIILCHFAASGSLPADSILGEYTSEEIDDVKWWTRFGDPMLDSLVRIVQERNYDLAIAAKRIDIAREGVRSARAGYYPQIDISGGWTRNRAAGAIEGRDVPAAVTSYWNAGATMRWEVDVFGKIRASVRQSQSELRVSRAEYASVMGSLQAQIATA